MVARRLDNLDSVEQHFHIPEEFHAPRPSWEERMASGKALRARVPHELHAEYKPASNRRDPVEILEEQAKTRLPFLVPIRYARMLTSPFAFLRGSAAVMSADLAPTPVTGLTVQACGDMHVANFGVFASAERNLVFGINDFDETLPGPWEWDLKRLAASFVVAARFLGADDVVCEEGARTVVRSYRKRMREYAEMSYLDVWYSKIDERGILDVLSPEARKAAEKIMLKARQKSGRMQVLGKMAEVVHNQHRIVESAPLIVRETHTQDGFAVAEVVSRVMKLYVASLPDDRKPLISRYRVVDVARKVVGVGSVGTRCWIILLNGNGPEDPLFLQYKEAQASVLAPYVNAPAWECEGQRVVTGQRMIQGAPDIFLGWGRVGDKHFYVRQLRDMKGGVDFTRGVANVKHTAGYAKLCGWALAMAHAKSGDPAAIAGYLGKSDGMDAAVARFAFAYAKQTERDHDALAKAAKAKRIEVAKAG
jgi:uncharacterized protein (DUF2252 family)